MKGHRTKLTFLIFSLWLHHCARGGDDPFTGGEEFIKNPLFQNKKEISVISPTPDSVKKSEGLTFRLKRCGTHQMIVIADSRMIVSENELSNWEHVGAGSKNIEPKVTTNPNLEVLSEHIMQVENGVELGESFRITSGRWYWASWGFTETGEIECSSIQVPFFVR